MKQNVQVTLDDELMAWTKKMAEEKKMGVSTFIRSCLELIRDPEKARNDPFFRFLSQ